MKTFTISVPCTDSLTFNITANSPDEALEKLRASTDCMEYHRKTYDGQMDMDAAAIVSEEAAT